MPYGGEFSGICRRLKRWLCLSSAGLAARVCGTLRELAWIVADSRCWWLWVVQGGKIRYGVWPLVKVTQAGLVASITGKFAWCGHGLKGSRCQVPPAFVGCWWALASEHFVLEILILHPPSSIPQSPGV